MSRRDGMARWGGSLGLVLLSHSLVLAALIGGGVVIPPPAEAPPVAMLIDLTPPPQEAPRPVEPPPAPQPKPTQQPRPKVRKTAMPAPTPVQPTAVAEPEEPQEGPPQTSAQSTPVAPPPQARPLSGAAVMTWQGQLLAHLERHKRYPGSARSRRQEGVTRIAFSMDRQGRLLAVSLRTSSGVGSLDEESVELLHRAQPLPPPPPEIGGERLDLVVPVEFFLSRR